ncbi:jg26281, partial [Pararge aegeria aegeria]
YTGMRKLKHNNGPAKRSVKSNTASKTEKAPPKLDSIDDDDQGFGGWLRSTEGVENMRLFVIANTIVLLTTLAYPHMQLMIEIISEAVYGPDGIF